MAVSNDSEFVFIFNKKIVLIKKICSLLLNEVRYLNEFGAVSLVYI